MSVGKSVRLFLVDGTPGGLITAEIMNWSGQVLAGPRSDLAALLRRAEARKPGIYILLGDDPEATGNPLAYVGESDDVSRRLDQHARSESIGGRDFWDRVVFITSKDLNLTKGHVKYLESRLIQMAVAAGRARMVNGTNPPLAPLPEADVSDMEYFLEQAKIILPVLGVNLLRATRPMPAPATPTVHALPAETAVHESPVFHITRKREGIRATAQEVDGEFIVREGSLAYPRFRTTGHNYEKLYERLVADGVLALQPDGRTRVFTRDHVFASPSAAAAAVQGRNANGRLEWSTDAGLTFAAWQEQLLPTPPQEGQ